MPLIGIHRHSIETMEGKRIGNLLWFTEVLLKYRSRTQRLYMFVYIYIHIHIHICIVYRTEYERVYIIYSVHVPLLSLLENYSDFLH